MPSLHAASKRPAEQTARSSVESACERTMIRACLAQLVMHGNKVELPQEEADMK